MFHSLLNVNASIYIVFEFILQKNGRTYMLGNKQVLIPHKVIQTLREWNELQDNYEEFDELATIALLLVCESADDLAAHNVSKDTKDLILGR